MTSGKKIFILCALCLAFSRAIGTVPSSPAKELLPNPRERYEAAQSLAEQSKYGRAAKAYGRFAADFPGSPLAAESKFRQAECLELMGNHYWAFQIYQELLEQYPTFASTSEVIDRQLRIGTALMNKKGLFGRNLSRAREIFRRVVTNAPFGESASRAQFNLAMTYEMRKLYSEAIMEYGKVISNYPGSDVVDDADYHLALCHYKEANRAPHDQSVASEAVSSLKGFLKRYPNNPKSQDAKAKLEEVAGRKAKALFDIAAYYEKVGSPKSAIYYYQEVIDGYPELEISRRAELKVKRDYELAKVDRRIEDLFDKLDTIKDEIRYSSRQVKKLRRPQPRWQVWKYLTAPKGPKGERLTQEKERLSSFKKEAREKKKEISKVLEERWGVKAVTSAQLRLDESRRKQHIARMNLEAAGDDRPGPSDKDGGVAQKQYERNLDKKRRKLERAQRVVSREERRLETVKERVESVKGRKEARIAKRSKLREDTLRRGEFRDKLDELADDLAAERKSARALVREEKKQAGLLKRHRKTLSPEDAAEAKVNLSLIQSRRKESQDRVLKVKDEIERRKRIHELEQRFRAVLRKERKAEANLHRTEAATYEKGKGFFSFFKGDPVSKSVERLDRFRRERRLLENELSALTAGRDFITEKERKREERRAELQRRKEEKVRAAAERKKEKALERERKAAGKEALRRKKLAEREQRTSEEAGGQEKGKREPELARKRKHFEDEEQRREKRAELERRRREKAEKKERKIQEKEAARMRAAADSRRKLEKEYAGLLEAEEAARAQLEELRAGSPEDKGGGWRLFRADPIRKAEKKLERLRKERASLMSELGLMGGEAASTP